MNILFIIDPIHKLKAYKDSSVAMMRAAIARGHRIAVCLMSDLYVNEGVVRGYTTEITIESDADLHATEWWKNIASKDSNLEEFDAAIMRKDPPFDMEYVYATHILDRLQVQGVKVFNTGAGIRNTPEKLSILEYPHLTSPTFVSSNPEQLTKFHEAHKDVVVKPLDGMGGAGIFRLRDKDPNRASILELLTHNGTQSIMAQRYIPEIESGDKRVLLIAGKPVPYCLARIPMAGETRGNLAAGGRGVAQPLNDADRELAERLGSILMLKGLFLVGLDIIGKYLTEINVTSPTCFVEITEQTGFDVAGMFIEHLEQAVR